MSADSLSVLRISGRRGAGAARAAVAPAVRLFREGAARVELAPRRWGRGLMTVFLPAGSPQGAALLRIYNVADALRPLGWRTAVLPWRLTLAARRRCLAALAPDVLVMQGARHPLNRPGLYPQWPVVYDMDDADFHLPRFEGPVTEAMAQVSGVIAGSRYIADWAMGQGAPRADVVWTGTPVSPGPRPPQQGRPPVVAWAQTRPMSYVREAAFVAEAMRHVAAVRPGTVLRLYDRRPGDDPGFADRFRAPGLRVEWHLARPYDAFLASLGDVAVGLAPLCPETPFSRGKSFGKVLAYLDAGVPVVASEACEHPAFFTPQTGVVSNDLPGWRDGVVRLLDDSRHRQAMADRAGAALRDRLSIAVAARQVDTILADVLERQGRPDCPVSA